MKGRSWPGKVAHSRARGCEVDHTPPLALLRIVTAPNLCEEYLDKQVYPRFSLVAKRALTSRAKGG